MTTQSIPKAMRAVLYNQTTRALKLVDSHPVPLPDFEKDEHLLKVHSVAITKGELTWPLPPGSHLDYSPGVEMSGTVITSPPGSKFSAGSHVYMRTTFPRSASAREYTIGTGKELALQPRTLTPIESASVPVSALTAWQALFVQAGLPSTLLQQHGDTSGEPGKKILVIGASGSAGLWITQLARAAGLWVVGTSHIRNINTTKDFGAHEVIDYTKTTVGQWLQDSKSQGTFDLVIDCVGGKNSTDAWHAAHSDHGLVISIVGPEDGVFKWVLDRPDGISENVNGRFFIMQSIGEQLQMISDLIDAGTLKTQVDTEYALEDYQKAFDRAESGKANGKVVIQVER